MEFVATCPKGFESLLAGELHSLGAEGVRPLVGQVSFTGSLADAYRCCLWSRLASNVTLVLARVGAANADQLYEGLSAIPWEDHVAPGATMAIEARGTNEQLRNTQFVALRSKDAVADRLLARMGARPLVNTDAPDVGIVVRLSRERALVGIDLTGEPLFNRGWESAAAGRGRLAPRRPDYAAALLEAGCWFRDVRHGSPVLVDLFPGTGSVAVEAASQALDRAPG
ncbi:MAG: RNA methyltransferase, partial [Olsenella sp.]|nr:RNA methyltransferase [Olsenella sp.]